MQTSANDSFERMSICSVLWINFVIAAAGLFMATRVHLVDIQELTGVVKSSGISKTSFGNREFASVRLQNGKIVLAQVTSRNALQSGDAVTVIEQQRFTGPANLKVVSRQSAR